MDLFENCDYAGADVHNGDSAHGKKIALRGCKHYMNANDIIYRYQFPVHFKIFWICI